MTHVRTDKRSGFSLIELMIAVALGMLAIAAVGSVFVYGSRNYRQDDKTSRMQDELRFAMAQLTADIEMAGFWAQIANPDRNIAVIPTTWSPNCGPTTNGGANAAGNNWVFQERRASLATRGNATTSPYELSGANANAAFACINSEDFQADTDIIAVKHLGDATATPENDRIYLRTNGVQSVIYNHSATPPDPIGANVTVYPYRVTVWYIRNYSDSPTENPKIPSLCREVLTVVGGTPVMQGDTGGCIGRGIEDMQFEFGIDSATSPDGIADQFVEYTTDPGAAVMSRVVAVRVHLLARSAEPDGSYTNEKSYTLGSKTIAAKNDGYYRRSLSSVVLVRNQANRLNPFALPTT